MCYYKKIKSFETEIKRICTEIFKVYGCELQLRLEEYNLLSNEHNCIQSSTAIGYIIEEFLVSKLEIYTSTDNKNKYRIKRNADHTTDASFDCSALIDNQILALVNIKAQQKSRNNNAVSAINKLYNDYVENNPKKEKCFLVLKITYDYIVSEKDCQRKIHIITLDSYFLEELDFAKNHHQDNRNWSENFNPDSGRLMVSNRFREENRIKEEEISYQNTVEMIKAIKDRNNTKLKKK